MFKVGILRRMKNVQRRKFYRIQRSVTPKNFVFLVLFKKSDIQLENEREKYYNRRRKNNYKNKGKSELINYYIEKMNT